MKLILTTILGLVCVTAAEARPATQAERAAILDWARVNLVDPYSLRSTGISDLEVVQGYGRTISAICVEYNARNPAGGYSGVERDAWVPQPDGSIVFGTHRQGVMTSTCWDPHVRMKPFKELSNIK